jgi:hypothetical protein
MSHVRRNVVLASIAAVLISLISTAFLTSQLLRGGGPDWSYYGYPFPIYRVENVDIVGTIHYFSPSSLVGDILVRFGASFVVISAFNAAQFMKHAIRNVAFVSTAGVAISLVSEAFLTSKLSPTIFTTVSPFPSTKWCMDMVAQVPLSSSSLTRWGTFWCGLESPWFWSRPSTPFRLEPPSFKMQRPAKSWQPEFMSAARFARNRIEPFSNALK